MLPYNHAILEIAKNSPGVDNPTRLFAWSEVVVDVLSTIYPGIDYDEILTDLIDAVKEYEEYEE